MQRLIVPLTLACLAKTANASDDLVLDMEDPWTIAAIVILSVLGLLLLVRMCMGMISISMESEVSGPEEVVVQLATTAPAQTRA